MTDSAAPTPGSAHGPSGEEPTDRADLVDAMETGSDAGTPGERPEAGADEELDEQDIEMAEAAADDRPLPAAGGPQDDGLAPQFHEPDQR